MNVTLKRSMGVVAMTGALLTGTGALAQAAFASPIDGLAGANTCPTGYKGVIVVVEGKPSSVCENIIS